MDTTDRIEELLDQAYSTDDPEEMENLAREVLQLEEDNVEALILLADTLEYSEEKIGLLEKAQDLLAEEMEGIPLDSAESILDDDYGMLYVAVMQRLGFALLSEGRNEEALEMANKIIGFDPEEETLGKTLLYRVLLEMGRDKEVLEEALKDKNPGLVAAHSKAIASFRLSGPTKGSYRALWEAFSYGPSVPFYILGYLEEPEEEPEELTEDYNFGLLFEDIWSSDHELLNWMTRGAILLGLTAGLFPQEMTEKMMILADALHIADFVEDAMIKAESRSDWGLLSQEEKVKTALEIISQGVYLPVKG